MWLLVGDQGQGQGSRPELEPEPGFVGFGSLRAREEPAALLLPNLSLLWMGADPPSPMPTHFSCLAEDKDIGKAYFCSLCKAGFDNGKMI